MLNILFRAPRWVAWVGLAFVLAACGSPEDAEPEAPAIEIAGTETATRPVVAAEVNESEPLRLYEPEGIDEFEVAGQDNADETPEIDTAGESGAAEADPLEHTYEELRALEPMQEEEALLAIQNADPMVRAQGTWNLEPEGEGLHQLLRLAAFDPDPVVRIAALASLEEGESFAAFKGLIDALQDPDPDVVVAAIDSLEFAGDESNLRDLEPLLWHNDARVAKAAARAINFLSD